MNPRIFRRTAGIVLGALTLTHCALEVSIVRRGETPSSIWTHLRIKPERFDISGGWVNDGANHITKEFFLKTLKHLHVNTAHLANTPGYTDTGLYARYLLKYFSKLTPFETYDTDAMLPRPDASPAQPQQPRLGDGLKPAFGGHNPVAEAQPDY